MRFFKWFSVPERLVWKQMQVSSMKISWRLENKWITIFFLFLLDVNQESFGISVKMELAVRIKKKLY